METPLRVTKYELETWENPRADAMRREECMCLHCSKLKPQTVFNCSMAETMFALCKTKGMAMAVTRCADWAPKADS